MNDSLKPEDLVVSTFSTTKGGFAVLNTNGVRLFHKPTHIEVECSSERSQHANNAKAREMLRKEIAKDAEGLPVQKKKRDIHSHKLAGQAIEKLMQRAGQAEALLEEFNYIMKCACGYPDTSSERKALADLFEKTEAHILELKK